MLVSLVGSVATSFVVGLLGVVTIRRPSIVAVGAALVLALLAGLGSPGLVHAAEVRFDKDGTVRVDAGESIDDTVFLAGETAIVAGVVEGDVFAAAERVEVTGTVRGNLYCAGETVTIAGEVRGNVHAAGKNVELGAKVGGSGFLAGQHVTLTEASALAHGSYLAGESVRAKGRVGRDVYLAGEKMEVSGNVARSVHAIGARFTLSSSGSVGGDVRVTVKAEDAAKIDDGATVKGETVIDVKDWEEPRAFVHPGFYAAVLAKTLALLIFGLVLVTLVPALRPSAPESSKEVLRNMGIGLAVLVATPVAMVLIGITLIGIPVSVLLGMVYAVLLYTSTLVVAYFAAQRLPADNDRRLVLWTGLCLLVIFFVIEIPFVGPVVHFLVLIFGLGCLVLHLWELYRESRGSTDASAGPPAVLATK